MATRRALSTSRIVAPPMTYISGEEMTRYAAQLMLDKWVAPHIDTAAWEYFDLSCKSRDDTEDAVLHDAVASGAKLGAIFKEPTITPTDVQKDLLGLKKAWGSPNGAMRKGWNGITISRDTIHIEGMDLGFKNPVLFERHAVGGEYGAGWEATGAGTLKTTFVPADGAAESVVDERVLTNASNVAVVYHNPLDNVGDLAHHFFGRCLEANVVPYVVTKKTVFKWQEGFWTIMKDVFDEHYKEKYNAAGLLKECGGELQHLISDAATMQIIRWTGGGFGMAAHNYDGDMLTDEIAQVHRSPGFITSNLIGKSDDGNLIKEYEASHGTVADLWHAHLAGEETSFNPLGMAEALIGAMQHAATLADDEHSAAIQQWTLDLRAAMHGCMVNGHGALCGVQGSRSATPQPR
jgi:isocitrate dehydrogenase